MQTSDRPVALLMVDLDHFKSINDQFGHAAGDEILRIFAKTASANLRPSDLVGRLGGEEFAVLLPAASQEGAWFVAERLRSAFATAAGTVNGLSIEATASVGMGGEPSVGQEWRETGGSGRTLGRPRQEWKLC